MPSLAAYVLKATVSTGVLKAFSCDINTSFNMTLLSTIHESANEETFTPNDFSIF